MREASSDTCAVKSFSSYSEKESLFVIEDRSEFEAPAKRLNVSTQSRELWIVRILQARNVWLVNSKCLGELVLRDVACLS